jgi:hypothetical protein
MLLQKFALASTVIMIALSALKSSVAQADTSCFPKHNALQLFERVNIAKDQTKTYLLNPDSPNRQWTEAQVSYSTQGDLAMTFKFEDRFDGVSIPYNISAVLVIQNGLPLTWLDLTRSCEVPPVGIFPGQKFRLPLGKLSGPQASLQIFVW